MKETKTRRTAEKPSASLLALVYFFLVFLAIASWRARKSASASRPGCGAAGPDAETEDEGAADPDAETEGEGAADPSGGAAPFVRPAGFVPSRGAADPVRERGKGVEQLENPEFFHTIPLTLQIFSKKSASFMGF